jgi:hypothetical protein
MAEGPRLQGSDGANMDQGLWNIGLFAGDLQQAAFCAKTNQVTKE